MAENATKEPNTTADPAILGTPASDIPISALETSAPTLSEMGVDTTAPQNPDAIIFGFRGWEFVQNLENDGTRAQNNIGMRVPVEGKSREEIEALAAALEAKGIDVRDIETNYHSASTGKDFIVVHGEKALSVIAEARHNHVNKASQLHPQEQVEEKSSRAEQETPGAAAPAAEASQEAPRANLTREERDARAKAYFEQLEKESNRLTAHGQLETLRNEGRDAAEEKAQGFLDRMKDKARSVVGVDPKIGAAVRGAGGGLLMSMALSYLTANDPELQKDILSSLNGIEREQVKGKENSTKPINFGLENGDATIEPSAAEPKKERNGPQFGTPPVLEQKTAKAPEPKKFVFASTSRTEIGSALDKDGNNTLSRADIHKIRATEMREGITATSKAYLAKRNELDGRLNAMETRQADAKVELSESRSWSNLWRGDKEVRAEISTLGDQIKQNKNLVKTTDREFDKTINVLEKEATYSEKVAARLDKAHAPKSPDSKAFVVSLGGLSADARKAAAGLGNAIQNKVFGESKPDMGLANAIHDARMSEVAIQATPKGDMPKGKATGRSGPP